MNWSYVLTGGILLVLAGLTGAEYLSTTITTDGTISFTSSGENENATIVSRVMTAGESTLARSITGDKQIEIDLSASGSGPVLISDYSSSRSTTSLNPVACVFLTEDRVNTPGWTELGTDGILQHGRYTIARVVGSELTGTTAVNGTGMLRFGSAMNGNTTMRTSGFVAGNMSIQDLVRSGGRI